METITVGGKVYPFKLTAYAVKKVMLTGLIDSDNVATQLDAGIMLIKYGIEGGIASLPFTKRLFLFTPSKSKIEKTLSVNEVKEVFGIFGTTKEGEQEPGK